ncbi:prostaglandin F2 receptor negative regulator [Sarotherodon galilaeus]
MTNMACLAALCLLLIFPLSSSQSTLKSEQKISAHKAPGAPPPQPPPPPHIRDLLQKEETSNLNAMRTYALVDKDNAKVGLFIAAAMGTFALMAAVYCIYNKFYTKQQYMHTQLNNDPDSMDPPPVFFHASVSSSVMDLQKAGYGSLSDTPSIISVPPSLSPPPSAMPLPALFLSSRSLRTISAKDLEKSYI